MFVHEPGECTRTRLELVLRSLRDLDHRRVRQMVLVRSALDPGGVQMATSDDSPEPGLIQDQDHRNQDQWEENLLQLKQQLRSLKIRDAGLVSQIRDLDRQILELRLDADSSHVLPSESPACNSRSSSGFYDFSEGLSLSNSLFSLSSTHDPETPPPSTEVPPTSIFGPQTLLCSLPSPSSSSPSQPPLCLLDSYILSLLHRRTPTSRPNQPRTTTQLLLHHQPHALSPSSPNPSSSSPNPCGASGPHAGFEMSQTSPEVAESTLSKGHLSPHTGDGTEGNMLKPRRRDQLGMKTPQSLDLDQKEDPVLREEEKTEEEERSRGRPGGFAHVWLCSIHETFFSQTQSAEVTGADWQPTNQRAVPQ
uniref:Uncharacterized protein n=1 Tax=Knipowitschia caucasica TaxID=637954 RepID=A0AAV2JD25_KNICA